MFTSNIFVIAVINNLRLKWYVRHFRTKIEMKVLLLITLLKKFLKIDKTWPLMTSLISFIMTILNKWGTVCYL